MEEEEEDDDFINNPLDNDLVLETLSKYVRRRDLLRYRLVCKKWNKSALARVRTEFHVRLDEASIGKYSSLSQFLSLLLSSNQIPYGSYLLLNLKLGNPLLQKLFTICGPLIKSLRIELSHFDLLDIYGLREVLLHRAPNIRILSLEGCLPEELISFPKFLSSVAGCRCDTAAKNTPILPNIQEIHVEGRKMHPNFLVDLLRSCPNLRVLKSNKNWGLDRSTLIISAVRDARNYRNLNAIHLNDVDGSHMNILLNLSQNKGLLLREFSFKILDSVDNASFQGLIDLQAPSLRELGLGEVTGSSNNVNLVLTFPGMKNLRRLSRVAVCKPEIILGPFCFATVTPNIVELIVQAFADEVQWNEYFADVNLLYPCHSVRRLALPTNLSDSSKLEKLGKMFPNVQKITADSPRNPVLSQLWTVWPDLVELNLTLSEKNEEVDSIFTGIPATTCDLINLSKNFDEVDIETVRVGPSISNLRGLRKLHVETSPIFWSENLFFCDNEPTCFLTNISGYFALTFLPNLEDISISCCEISDDCCKYLSKIFQAKAKIFISARNHVPVFECDELQ